MISNQPVHGNTSICVSLREIVVVIPAHNERDRLPRCLASVAAAAEQVDVPVNVVVVLDACTDRSEDVLTESVRVVSVSVRNVGAARAAGCIAGAPDADAQIWLATTDADCVVPTRWLSDQMEHHSSGAQGAVGTVKVQWREHSAATRRRYDRLYRPESTGSVRPTVTCTARTSGSAPTRIGESVDFGRYTSARMSTW